MSPELSVLPFTTSKLTCRCRQECLLIPKTQTYKIWSAPIWPTCLNFPFYENHIMGGREKRAIADMALPEPQYVIYSFCTPGKNHPKFITSAINTGSECTHTHKRLCSWSISLTFGPNVNTKLQYWVFNLVWFIQRKKKRQAKQTSKQTLSYCEGGQTIEQVPRAVVKPSSLDVFKTQLDIALGSLH